LNGTRWIAGRWDALRIMQTVAGNSSRPIVSGRVFASERHTLRLDIHESEEERNGGQRRRARGSRGVCCYFTDSLASCRTARRRRRPIISSMHACAHRCVVGP
jgi:hypothetical protein